MNYNQPLNDVPFGRFDSARLEEYKQHLNPGNALVFSNSADLLNKVAEWLEEAFPGGEFVAAKGRDHLAEAVIVIPKTSGEVNRDFSKDLHESKLAKMKSKLGPQ